MSNYVDCFNMGVSLRR